MKLFSLAALFIPTLSVFLHGETIPPRIVNLSTHDTRTPNLDFDILKKGGASAVIIRASIGDGNNTYAPAFPDTDSEFKTYLARARSAGLRLGAYHLVRAGQDGKLQADHFLTTIKRALPANAQSLKILLVADGGWSDRVRKATSTQELADFVKRVRETTGVYPGIYPEKNERFKANLSMATDEQRSVFKKCWLWLPDYSRMPARLAGWDKLLPGPLILHQYGGVINNEPIKPAGFDDHLVVPYRKLEKSIFLGNSLDQFWEANSAKFSANERGLSSDHHRKTP